MTAFPLDSLAVFRSPHAARFVPLGPHDVLPLSAYERVRARYLRLCTELKRQRRARLAPEVGILFESRETVLLQIHEVLRLEGHTPAHVTRELTLYDCLVPRPGELRATVMIDGDTRERGRALAAALRRPGAVTLSVEGITCGSTLASADDDADDPVQYLRFRPPPPFAVALRRRDAALGLAVRIDPRVLVTFAHRALRDQLRDDLLAPPARPLLHALHACPWMLDPTEENPWPS